MAKKEKIHGSTKRFGSRYGRKIRQKVGQIEKQQSKKHKCPYCNAKKVKRSAVGIWECSKCESRFTSKAYTVAKKVKIKQEVAEAEEIDIEEAEKADTKKSQEGE